MRIGVMASGAVGGYFGARLAQAGHDVVFFARGDNLRAMRENGLRIESPLGELHLTNPTVTHDASAVGPVDYVLLAVKLWSVEEAGTQIKPIVGPQTRVITLMNGIDSEERLRPILGPDIVVPGIAFIASVIAGPGVIRHTSPFAYIHYGRSDQKVDPLLVQLTDTARATNVDFRLSNDIQRDLWQKFAFLVGLSSATGALRSPLGPILADEDTRQFIHDIVKEVVAVGVASGASIASDYADTVMKFCGTLPPGLKASLLNDLERGNRIELDWLGGKVVTLGRELGVPTPSNDAAYAVLKLHRMGRPT